MSLEEKSHGEEDDRRQRRHWNDSFTSQVLRSELCSFKINIWKSQPQVPYNVNVFGDSAFKEVLKLN